MDENEEIRRARSGDREACGRLFSRHWPLVRGWMLGVLRDPDEAEDLTQQVFLRAFTRLAQLRDPERFLPWLRAVARSVARNRLRRPAAPVRVVERESGDPAVRAQIAETRESVRRALGRLGARDRVLLTMVVVEELPLAGAARFLDVPVTTLRRRLARAAGRLGRSLEREGIRHAV